MTLNYYEQIISYYDIIGIVYDYIFLKIYKN
uniref:Uncharacterized protein n=1 Tax=viral metagenome TaxID=1070528 RepID=A0A6C0JDD5_9ZZZZ